MIAWIFADEAYTELYHWYYREFLSTCLESGWCEELIASTAALIAPYVEADPTAFCTYEEFQAGTAALTRFCQLRAQSAAGQLEGSVPSTTQGQTENPGALVDASDLELADMGSMGMGGGGRQEEQTSQNGPPQAPETPPDFGGEARPAFAPMGGGGPGGNGPGGDSPGGDGGVQGQWLLLLLCVGVLAAGLLFALGFRRRGR